MDKPQPKKLQMCYNYGGYIIYNDIPSQSTLITYIAI